MGKTIKVKQTALAKRSRKEETCRVFVIDEFDEETKLIFKLLEYNNLMDLVLNELWEEWGDCRGRAMCGTCQIEIIDGHSHSELEAMEEETLELLPNKTPHSRLACQITLDRSIDNLRFRILKDF